MTNGEKMIWASTYSLILHQWHLDGQPTDFNEAIKNAISEATGAVVALQETVSDRFLDQTDRKFVKEILK